MVKTNDKIRCVGVVMTPLSMDYYSFIYYFLCIYLFNFIFLTIKSL